MITQSEHFYLKFIDKFTNAIFCTVSQTYFDGFKHKIWTTLKLQVQADECLVTVVLQSVFQDSLNYVNILSSSFLCMCDKNCFIKFL